MIKYLFFFLFSLNLVYAADKILVGSTDSNLGFLKIGAIQNILECAVAERKLQIKMISLPKQRIKHSFNEELLDAFYPISLEENKSDLGLFPLYIDELLLIYRKDEKPFEKLNVGGLKEDIEYLKKFDKRITKLYSVSSVDALFGGLERHRSDAVVVRRSQLTNEINLKNYKVESLHFEVMGLKVSNSFLRKTELSIEQLNKKFIHCLSAMDFKLENSKKELIYNELSKDFVEMSSRLLGPFPRYDNHSIQEKIWNSGDSKSRKELVKSILDNKYTRILKSFKAKYKYINEIFIFNKDGSLVSSLKETSDFDQSDEDKFKLLLSSKSFEVKHIQNIYFDRSEEVFQLGISIPIYDDKGLFIGGLYVASDINELLLYYRLHL